MLGLGIGMGRVAASASSIAFTPEQSFQNGELGGWWEPKPQYLWQDAAGTVPVTQDGDLVARMEDRSGNGHHFTQDAGTERMVYRTDGVLHWLEGDAVDDDIAALGTATALQFLHTGVDSQFSIAAFTTPTGSNQNLMGTANGFSNTQIGSCISLSSAGAILHAVTNGDGVAGNQARVTGKSINGAGEAVVSTNLVTTGTLQGRTNSVGFGTDAVMSPGAVDSTTDLMIPGDPTHPAIRFYGALVRNAVDQVNEIEQYLSKLAGSPF